MDWITIVLALVYFALIGWVVHRIMGMHGSILHWAFIGGCGSSVGALLEWMTGKHTTTFLGAIGLCIVCSAIVEYGTLQLKTKLDAKREPADNRDQYANAQENDNE